jgi:hypothetical protein
MNNLRTKRRRLVLKTESTTSENGERLNREYCGDGQNLRTYRLSKVIVSLSPVGTPRTPECKRHYNLYGGAQRYVGDRGGESNAG